MTYSVFFSMLETRNGGPLHHLHWLLFWVASFLLGLSIILLVEIRRADSNDSQTMKDAREWRQRLLGLVYNWPQSARNAEQTSTKNPTSGETRTMRWDEIWSKVSMRFRMLSRIIAERWMRSDQDLTSKVIFVVLVCLISFTVVYAAYGIWPTFIVAGLEAAFFGIYGYGKL